MTVQIIHFGSEDVCFADPLNPWQRFINENINGLIHQFLSREIDIGDISRCVLNLISLLVNIYALELPKPTGVLQKSDRENPERPNLTSHCIRVFVLCWKITARFVRVIMPFFSIPIVESMNSFQVWLWLNVILAAWYSPPQCQRRRIC